MNEQNGYTQDFISESETIIEVKNALVEEMYTPNSRTGYLLISYATAGENDMVNMELVHLNIGWDTILINQYGEHISLCSITKGTYVNASFSSIMTRSIPPQSNAYRVVALVAFSSYSVTTDRIIRVDKDNNFLYTGNPDNETEQMRFVLSSATTIVDQEGTPVSLDYLTPGELVRIEHASFSTASIPPQTTAFLIQILS